MIAPQKLKLQHHQTHDVRGIVGSKEHTVIEFDQPDVLLSSRGTHGISAGDVIEVYHPEDAHHALFLVPYLRDDVQLRDVISIEHSIAQTFKLQPHKVVCVQVVDKESVTLDLVELYIRDQYFSRSDSYRFIQQLTGGVLQVNKKIGYNQMRVQVGELWRKGEKYSSGYVGPETKIAFRSSTAVMQIFIQLSKEMWLFDEHGDLYFEKTLKFLSELFLKFWPESNSNHDGSIIFFTRVFLDDLPSVYQKRANCNAEGRFFEDFYRVIVQNERFTLEEWKRVLTQLKLEFKVFLREITTYLSTRYPICDGADELTTYVSCAPDGNFLEALNMAMNRECSMCCLLCLRTGMYLNCKRRKNHFISRISIIFTLGSLVCSQSK
ncbi:hypothetical protein PHET_12019 [Paragonimus heterotremus]|uniref:DEP domain-containing protein n=1 Tax=Paragonimus heterotremus TaxID=100268 RepID=A0A8J4T3C1_9TREM|nr:hypothetical protein PHET_12019 [Paragonimus heterotremus]